jgi:hypothetical protein
MTKGPVNQNVARFTCADLATRFREHDVCLRLVDICVQEAIVTMKETSFHLSIWIIQNLTESI